jgi:mannose-6-phosphate isomerase-like protein (cupin superfamily)
MIGFVQNIEQLTVENENFRKVLYTAKHSQLVLMSLKPGEEIGEEVHDVDQFFRFEKGEGRVFIDGTESTVSDGTAVIVPAGASHNVVNASETEMLKLYTLYCPPHHKVGTVHATKEQAEADEEEFDGVLSE